MDQISFYQSVAFSSNMAISMEIEGKVMTVGLFSCQIRIVEHSLY